MHLFSFSQVKIYEVEIQNKNEVEIKSVGRPKLGQREQDEDLFKTLEFDPDGSKIQRAEWQKEK